MKVCIRIIQNEAGGYTAACPTLPGCVSVGPTREQAEQRLEEAIRGYIAALGDFVPESLTHEVVEV